MAASYLGLDIGSSSIKAALLDAKTNTCVASAQSPVEELAIQSPQSGFAEQDPELWWTHAREALELLKRQNPEAYAGVQAIGISYQMHGLVLLDEEGKVLRPSIIWCDSRASALGEKAFQGLGREYCLTELLNSPGNFTAAKCAWVKEHEAELFARAKTLLLPGDYIAYKLSGERTSSFSGMSEGILWNFAHSRPAYELLDFFGIPRSILPELLPSFQNELKISAEMAGQLGLSPHTLLSYRAGDQPNNALSLGVLEPGEIAATAGTSGVVYGVGDKAAVDPQGRVNTFLHVNSDLHVHPGSGKLRLGTLLCVNGCGSLYRWIRENLAKGLSYEELNALAAKAPAGSQKLFCLPYGNGAERSLGNIFPGAAFLGLDFNRHSLAELLRASLEGIAFSFAYGIEAMRAGGVIPQTIRAGHANLFKSPIFREILATVSGAHIDLLATDGAQGAARGAAIGKGDMPGDASSFTQAGLLEHGEPNKSLRSNYEQAYAEWKHCLSKLLEQNEEEKKEFLRAA